MKLLFVIFIAGAVSMLPAEENLAVEKKAVQFDVGGDFRVRQEIFMNLPNRSWSGTPSLMPDQDYFRIRSRIWGEAEYKNLRLYTRLANEFRDYNDPSDSRMYKFPDELFVDNLYFDVNGLFDGWLDLRVGRQDLKYGSGRVIADGTPMDGTRSVFIDAVKASIVFDEKRKNVLDLLAIYNKSENELSLGGLEGVSDRQIRSVVPGSSNQDEWGGAAYFRSKELDAMPFDLYWIYKRETKADYKGAKWPGRSFHTWGTLLKPQYTETLSGEIEGAFQAGERDGGKSVSGYMLYSALIYKPSVEWKLKPYIKPAFYYLSGDTDRSSGHADSGWNPVWARYPQGSPLMCMSYKESKAYWTNLIYPHLETGFKLSKKHKLRMTAGPMYVDKKDGLGGGDGNFYGWLGTCRYDFPVLKNFLKRKDKRGNLFGRLEANVLDPGDYYDSDKLAWFFRWELLAKF